MRLISRLQPCFQPRLRESSSCVICYTSRRWLQHRGCAPRKITTAKIQGFLVSPKVRQTSHVRSDITHDPTIYALSSGSGRAAIAVIRISGPACIDIYKALCPGKALPKPRVAAVRTLYRPGVEGGTNDVLDSNALLLYFPAPKSATGEDILELHVHGGPAVVKAVLAAVATCAGSARSNIRYAEPGEFTRRAFFNNRLDLTQVEALGDVLTADTEQQRRLSVRGTSNSLSKLYETWRSQLLYARGELEALIDFSEDQHFDESPSELYVSVAAQVKALRSILRLHSKNAVRGELLRNGITISLLGAPNAGKSSLFNRIVGREAAIVSHEAGTTRDVVEVGLDIGGYLCRFGDTAGLRTALHPSVGARSNGSINHAVEAHSAISKIEEEGVRRAKIRAEESDVVVVVLSFEPRNSPGGEIGNKVCSDQSILLQVDPEVRTTASRLIRQKSNVIVVINKADLANQPHMRREAVQNTLAAFPGLEKDAIYLISCMITPEQDAGFTVPASNHHQATQKPNVTHMGKSSDWEDAEKEADTEDPGGIQALLQGLSRKFTHLTNALTEVDHVDVESISAHEEVDADLPGPKNAVAAAPLASTVGLGCTTSTISANDAHDPTPSLSTTNTLWDESLGASVRHRELLDECILHLDLFLAAVLKRENPLLTTFGHSPATLERSHSMVDPSPVAGAYAISEDQSFTLRQPYARIPVPDRPRVEDHIRVDNDDVNPDIIVVAEHLRAAADCLARITGRGKAGDVEEVLGVVFEKFCVGK